jgi:hypothetical protein
MHEMFFNTQLSIYNYNQILSGWSRQINSLGGAGISNTLSTSSYYGGCELNGQAGIDGRIRLQSHNRTFNDQGEKKCSLIGTLEYKPRTETGGPVTAILRLNLSGTVLSSGWQQVDGFTYTKVYYDNTTEVVDFESPFGPSVGSGLVHITWINKNKPTGSLSYTPATFTNGAVRVTLVMNMTGTVVTSGRTSGGDGVTFWKDYTAN